MQSYLLKRVSQSLITLVLVSLFSFSLMHFVPGDPAMIIGGLTATEQELEEIRRQLGLNASFLEQLFRQYLGLLQGDLGHSYLLGRSVVDAIVERLPISLSLTLFALLLTLAIGIPAGIVAALRPNSWIDQIVLTMAMLGVSLPNFWLGLMLIIVFSVTLGLLPSGGYVPLSEDPLGWLRSIILPSVSLAFMQAGLLARATRATMLEVLRQDYVRTARAKGLPGYVVVGKHALKNVMIPVITVIGIIMSLLLSGSVIIETVYSIPGVGRLLANAVITRDYPVIQGGLLFVAALLMLLNLIVDLLYAYFDPRVQYG